MTSGIDRELDIAMVAELYYCAPNSCICNSLLGLGKLALGARRPSIHSRLIPDRRKTSPKAHTHDADKKQFYPRRLRKNLCPKLRIDHIY